MYVESTYNLIMNKFKAAVLEKLDSPLQIREISCEDPKEGQVFVKILSSGLMN